MKTTWDRVRYFSTLAVLLSLIVWVWGGFLNTIMTTSPQLTEEHEWDARCRKLNGVPYHFRDRICIPSTSVIEP